MRAPSFRRPSTKAVLGKGVQTQSQEEGGALIFKKTRRPLCVPGTQELLGSGPLSPQGPPLFPSPLSFHYLSLLPKLCGKADVDALSATAWPVMALRQACLWLGFHRLCRPLVFTRGKSIT